MYLFLLVLAFVMLIVLIFFTVVIGLKACSFLDGLAKQADIDCMFDGFEFEKLIRNPNRNKKENSIRNKIKERMIRFDKRERRK